MTLKTQVLAVLTLFGCVALGNVYLPLSAYAQPSNNASSSTPESTGAIEVKSSILATIGHHPQIKALQENRQAAIHDVSRARSGWLPRIDARAGYGAEQVNDSTTRSVTGQKTNTYYDRTEASLTFQQTLWDGMSTWNRVEQGQATLESVESRLLDNTEGLSLDAIRAHIEVARQRRIVALSERNIQNHKDILESQKQRQRLGASSLADVTQTEGRLARAQASLAENYSTLEIAVANYKRLTGKEPTDLLPASMPAGAYPSLDAALASARTNNPKVKAGMADIKVADAQIEIGKANFHPQIYIDGGPYYRWRVDSSETYAWGNSVMLRASWNLFDGFYDWYNFKGNRARLRQSRETLVDTYESLAETTESTWSQLISAREQARYFSNAVEFNTQTRDMYLEQFNLGERSLLDVLDAENELYSSSIQLVTATQNEIVAQYRLLALGGELLKEFGINPALYMVDADKRANERQER
ncbi:TolC family outer membrane protein [Desulfovibrio litoralis]|nr:TolC family outer membrane protein [Desulfovibrio litoralis]